MNSRLNEILTSIIEINAIEKGADALNEFYASSGTYVSNANALSSNAKNKLYSLNPITKSYAYSRINATSGIVDNTIALSSSMENAYDLANEKFNEFNAKYSDTYNSFSTLSTGFYNDFPTTLSSLSGIDQYAHHENIATLSSSIKNNFPTELSSLKDIGEYYKTTDTAISSKISGAFGKGSTNPRSCIALANYKNSNVSAFYTLETSSYYVKANNVKYHVNPPPYDENYYDSLLALSTEVDSFYGELEKLSSSVNDLSSKFDTIDTNLIHNQCDYIIDFTHNLICVDISCVDISCDANFTTNTDDFSDDDFSNMYEIRILANVTNNYVNILLNGSNKFELSNGKHMLLLTAIYTSFSNFIFFLKCIF